MEFLLNLLVENFNVLKFFPHSINQYTDIFISVLSILYLYYFGGISFRTSGSLCMVWKRKIQNEEYALIFYYSVGLALPQS